MATTQYYRKSHVRPVSVAGGEGSVLRETGHFTAQPGTAAAVQTPGPQINAGPGNVATVAPVVAPGAIMKTYTIDMHGYGPSGTLKATSPDDAWAKFAAANGIVAAECDVSITEFI